MTQTNLDAYALANGFGKTTAEMTEAEKVNLRFQYVMNATRNSAGDFARTSDGTANSSRVFKESLKELGETFGQELLPVVTPFIQEATDLIKQFGALDSQTKKNIITAGGLLAVAGPALTGIGKVSSGVSSLSKLLGSGGLFGKLADATSGTTKLTGGMKGLLPSLTKVGGGAKTATTALSGLSVGAVGLAAGIPALLMGFGDWYYNMLAVKNGSQELIDKNREISESNDILTANIESNMERRQANIQSIERESAITGTIADNLFKTVEQYGKTEEAQMRIQPIIDMLNERVSGLNLTWDEQNRQLSMNRDEIEKTIQIHDEEIQKASQRKQLEDIQCDLYDAEKAYNDEVQRGADLKIELAKILDNSKAKWANVADEQQRCKLILDDYHANSRNLIQDQIDNQKALKETADRVNGLRDEYATTYSEFTNAPKEEFERVQSDLYTLGADNIQAITQGYLDASPKLQKAAKNTANDAANAMNSEEQKNAWNGAGWNLGQWAMNGFSTNNEQFRQLSSSFAQTGKAGLDSQQESFSLAGIGFGGKVSQGMDSISGLVRAAGVSMAGASKDGWNAGMEDAGASERITRNFADRMKNAVKDVLGIHSPSTEMYEIGTYFADGFINGLGDSDILSFTKGIALEVLEAFNAGRLGLSTFLDALGGGYNGIKKFVNFSSNVLGGGFSGIANGLMGAIFGKGGVTPKTDMMWVSDSRDITSWFGYRDDVAGVGSSNHGGIDIGAPYGSPIYAPASGNVISAGWNGGYGNAVTIQLDNGFEVLFGHMSGFAVGSGQRVNPGQIVGYVGSTGNSTGPHIHYSVFLNGQAIDPAQFYGFSVGSRYVPYDMPAIVHQGEMIVPRSENPYANSGGSITGGLKNEIVSAVVQALSTQKGNVTFNQTIVTPEYSPSQIRRQTERLLNGAFSPI